VIGAVAEGFDLSQPLAADALAALRAALDDRLVVAFRDQKLEPEQLVAFGRQLGTLEIHPFAPKHPDFEEMVVLDQRNPVGEGADNWHADATFQRAPPGYEILHAIQVPSLGGDTLFANMFEAFDALSPPLQRLLERVEGVHDLSGQLASAIDLGYSADDLSAMQRRWPPVHHPAGRTHPRSGRKALFVNRNFTTRLAGLTQAESERLLTFLFEHLREPAFQCRLRWQPGSVVVWDNRFVQHFAVPDYDERRVMHRLNLAGDIPR
jgi:taurine dioxygenase